VNWSLHIQAGNDGTTAIGPQLLRLRPALPGSGEDHDRHRGIRVAALAGVDR
jgi:hypothetical protein